MQLAKKKQLAAKVLKVGKNRIVFSRESLNEIKEAITRVDMMDLHKSGAIKIKDKKGRKKIKRRKHRRGIGKVKKRVKKRKQEYVKITRKLRKQVKSLLNVGKIEKEKYRKARTMIKARKFRSKRHLNEGLGDI
jgi:large subunit ribosomal protein L19e